MKRRHAPSEDAFTQAASATEATGLVPALTDENGEAAERALYAVQPEKRRGK